MAETETTAETAALPGDEEIARERANASRKANLEKARLARSEKARARKTADETAAEKGGQVRDRDNGALFAGCRALVRFCWLVSKVIAYAAGGQLGPLSDSDLDEGAKEAECIVRRFEWLAGVLAFVGFPLWMARVVADKFSRNPTAAGGGASQGTSAPAAATPGGGNVLQISGGKP